MKFDISFEAALDSAAAHYEEDVAAKAFELVALARRTRQSLDADALDADDLAAVRRIAELTAWFENEVRQLVTSSN